MDPLKKLREDVAAIGTMDLHRTWLGAHAAILAVLDAFASEWEAVEVAGHPAGIDDGVPEHRKWFELMPPQAVVSTLRTTILVPRKQLSVVDAARALRDAIERHDASGDSWGSVLRADAALGVALEAEEGR